MKPEHENARYHALDALRAFALLLGVVFHAAESFEAGHRAWAIVDNSPSTVLHLFRHASHSFRLEIFFLIAGFFAHLLYHRRGAREFARNRVSRILVPLVIGWCVLYPVLVHVWLWGASKSGNWEFIGVPPEVRHLAPWQLTLGFFVTLSFLQKFDLTHLWFLHQLLILYLLVFSFRALFVRYADRSGAWRARCDRWFSVVIASRWKGVLLTLPTVPMLMLMDSWSVDTPKQSLLPHPPATLLFGYFFVCGMLLHRQPGLLVGFARSWGLCLALGLLLVWPTRYLGEYLGGAGFIQAHYLWARFIHFSIYGLMMWGFVLGFSGLFLRLCAQASAFWRYVSDASYWVYLLHLPVVVSLQVLLGRVHLHWTVKYPIILLLATPVLFLSYHFLVRPTFIGAQLNGRRYPLGRIRAQTQ